MDQTIHFYLPSFYGFSVLNLFMADTLRKYPEYFYEGIDIGAVYGCFPGSIWNGGRLQLGTCTKNQIEITIREFNKRKIPCRFTFTNPLLEEKHLYDTFCNLCLTIGDNGMNEVLVNSPILEAYIRERYPSYKILSSTTKCLQTPAEFEAEAQQDYSLVVLNPSLNNTDELFAMQDKEKYELLVDVFCADNCPRRAAHYEAIGKAQLEFSDLNFGKCDSINRNFYTVMQNRSFISAENLYGKYYEAGFRHFKLEGRTYHRYKVLESYMYYMVRPEHRDTMRMSVLTALEKYSK